MGNSRNPLVRILDFLIGKKVLFQGRSPFNGEIIVIQDIFGKSLLASGLTQSGGMIGPLWEKAISKLKDQQVEKILILGLGAGSCLGPIRKRWQRAKIIGIEVDPKMIELGKKFFGLSNQNLQIKIGDANKFVAKTKNTYDLILVDLFSGKNYPKFLDEKFFLENLKRILEENGILIFNHLYFKNHREPSGKFLEKLKKFFAHITLSKFPHFFPTNLLIFCQN